MAKKNKNNSRNNAPAKPTAKQEVFESVIEVNNKNNNNDQEITMSTINEEIANAKSMIKNAEETKKAIKACNYEIKAINLAIKNRIKLAGNCTSVEKEALSLDFKELLINQQLKLEALTKREAIFTAENTEAFGIMTADKIADFVEKSPINSGLSAIAQLKNRLKKD